MSPLRPDEPRPMEAAARPLVSVVMNCFNGERYLREAIDSIFAQTYANWELVFWDNCSTDRSAEIVATYDDGRIRYFAAPMYTALCPARGRALQRCRGDYLCFLDCDDVYLPENLQTKLDYLQRAGGTVAYGGIVYIDEQGAEKGQQLPVARAGSLFESLLLQFDANISTLIVDKSVMHRRGINFSEDVVGSTEYDLLMQLLVTERGIIIPRHLAKVRHHRNSLTYSVMNAWASDRTRVLSKLEARHPGIGARFPAAFAEAYARADYYSARWLMESGRRREALEVLRKAAPAGWRYCALYLVLRISTRLWYGVHRQLLSARRL